MHEHKFCITWNNFARERDIYDWFVGFSRNFFSPRFLFWSVYVPNKIFVRASFLTRSPRKNSHRSLVHLHARPHWETQSIIYKLRIYKLFFDRLPPISSFRRFSSYAFDLRDKKVVERIRCWYISSFFLARAVSFAVLPIASQSSAIENLQFSIFGKAL
jgi:hypothetical protein